MQQSSPLERALDFTSRLYARVALREMRSHTAIRMFVGGLGLAVREARRDPEMANDICRKAGIKARRLEVRVTRLIAGRRSPRRQDQIPRWANCAAYIAHPPNGDLPPADWRQAARYISRRGGLRRLSDLYACRVAEREDTHGIYFRSDTETPTADWYTPPYIFDALGCRFDLDPGVLEDKSISVLFHRDGEELGIAGLVAARVPRRSPAHRAPDRALAQCGGGVSSQLPRRCW